MMGLPQEFVNVIGVLTTGYQAGLEAAKQQYAGVLSWEPFVKALEVRHGQMVYQKVIKPIPTITANPATEAALSEAVRTYAFGFARSSVYNSGRLLEMALASAYELSEGKPPPKKLEDLINWFGAKYPQDKPLASSIQILRNTIHTIDVITDQMALETLRHATEVLNRAFPYAGSTYLTHMMCPSCGQVGAYDIGVSLLYLGNNVAFDCGKCRVTFNQLVMA
jgi:hypothetical protein